VWQLPFFVAIPLAAAFVLPLLERRGAAAPHLLANAALALLAALSVVALGREGSFAMGGWDAPIGIRLHYDGLSSLMLLLVDGIALLVGLYSVEFMTRYGSLARYYGLLLFMVTGMNGAVLAGDLFNLYVFIEIAGVASYALVAFGREAEDLEAAFRYAVLGSLASTLILTGVVLVYAVTGTLDLGHVAAGLADAGRSGPLHLAVGLFLAGLALKAALAPFHAWLPDAHPAAPAPVSALLSGVFIKAIGVYVLARLVFNVLGPSAEILAVLRWLGILSMVMGGLLALRQQDIKRLLAYSSIGQVGYVVVALGLGTPLGLAGALFHLVNHAVCKALLFLDAGAVERAAGTRDLRELGGLGRVIPVASRTSLIASLSISGVPPFGGFWSKLLIVVACIEAGQLGLAVAAVLFSVVTLGYQLRLQRDCFDGPTPASAARVVPGTPALMAVPMVVLSLLCVGMGLVALPGLAQPLGIAPAVAVLLEGVGGKW
jgi:multicomponent Na+:H+ antiporter subunit D